MKVYRFYSKNIRKIEETKKDKKDKKDNNVKNAKKDNNVKNVKNAKNFKNLKNVKTVTTKTKDNKYKIIDPSPAKETTKVEESIISRNIHGKYSRTMMCENWKEKETSEDDFTVVSLQIPSVKQLMVHLKLYPSEPIDNNVVVDFDFKFERYKQ